MRIFENYKTIRISGQAHRQLQEMAEREGVTLKEAVDILLDLRGEIQADLRELKTYFRMLLRELLETKSIGKVLQDGDRRHVRAEHDVQTIIRSLRK